MTDFDIPASWAVLAIGEPPKPLPWRATQRYGITPAPGTLGLVHDFLNTRSGGGVVPDLLSSPDTARQWADDAFETWSTIRAGNDVPFTLDGKALPELRDLRDTLSTTNAFRVATDRRAVMLVTSTRDDGQIDWQPAGVGAQRLISALLTEVLLAQHNGAWVKMRQCRDPRCLATFFDRTWNQRQIWHDTAAVISAKHPTSPVRR